MKAFKKSKSESLYEIVLPFDSAASPGDSELFDDCPMCQELKRQLELGEVSEVDGEAG